jgi:hypothetical protein
MKTFIVCIGLATAFTGAASGASAQSKASDRASQAFITKAVQGNVAVSVVRKFETGSGLQERRLWLIWFRG